MILHQLRLFFFQRFYFFIFIILSLGIQHNNQAQNEGNAILVNFGFGGNLSRGDMENRFSNFLQPSLGAEFITAKGNWFGGLYFAALTNGEVRENVVSNLQNDDGIIIGDVLVGANPLFKLKGFYSAAYLGRLIPILTHNQRSGIRVEAGLGLLQHKINIKKDPNSLVEQLNNDLVKGYDRLTNGLCLHQFIGYQHLSLNKLSNFVVGFEFKQGFTQNRRDINYDTGQKDTNKRIDLIYGIKIAWILPFYLASNGETIYY